MDEILRLKSVDKTQSRCLTKDECIKKYHVGTIVFKLLSLPSSCMPHHILAIKYKIMSFVIT